jgi:uncharacterized protein YukE
MYLRRCRLVTKSKISDYEREMLLKNEDNTKNLSRAYTALQKMKEDLKKEETPIKRRYLKELVGIYQEIVDKYEQLNQEEKEKYEKSMNNIAQINDNVAKTNNKLKGYVEYYKLKYENESNYIKKVSYKHLYEIYKKMKR